MDGQSVIVLDKQRAELKISLAQVKTFLDKGNFRSNHRKLMGAVGGIGKSDPGPNHSVLSDVSWANYRHFMERLGEVVMTASPGC